MNPKMLALALIKTPNCNQVVSRHWSYSLQCYKCNICKIFVDFEKSSRPTNYTFKTKRSYSKMTKHAKQNIQKHLKFHENTIEQDILKIKINGELKHALNKLVDTPRHQFKIKIFSDAGLFNPEENMDILARIQTKDILRQVEKSA